MSRISRRPHDTSSMPSNNTTFFQRDGITSVTLHQTEIVRADADNIVLSNGGYDTRTTRERMVQASNQFGLGFTVFRRNGTTYAKGCDGIARPFETSTITLPRSA